MKNKEKYEKEIMELACNGRRFAVDINTNEVLACVDTSCNDCAFKTKTCSLKKRKEWAESEYKEPISAKTVKDKFHKFCHDKDCEDCEYSSTRFVMDCKIRFVVDNYNLTEKEAENG